MPGGPSYLIGERIIREKKIIRSQESGSIYLYKDGYYNSEGSEIILRRIITEIIGSSYSSHQVNEILTYIKDSTSRATSSEDTLPYICLDNCIFNTDTSEACDYNPDIFITNKIPVQYKPDADPGSWIEYVSSLVSSDEYEKTLQEFAGYVFVGHQKAKKLLFTYGNENSGKSTYYGILTEFYERKNCSTLSLDQLCEKFSNAELYGKIANIRADIEYELAPKSVNLIKSLTGDDEISVQKKFLNPFSFKNKAKIFLSANGIPNLPKSGVDRSFYSRWIPIEFPHTFTGSMDTRIKEKYSTPEAKSAILNWALEGLKRLKNNNWQFTYSPSISEIKEWFSGGTIYTDVESFIAQCCLPHPDRWVEKIKLYRRYDEWCNTRGTPKLEINAFHRQVKNNRVHPVINFRPLFEGEQTEAWKGIYLQ